MQISQAIQPACLQLASFEMVHVIYHGEKKKGQEKDEMIRSVENYNKVITHLPATVTTVKQYSLIALQVLTELINGDVHVCVIFFLFIIHGTREKLNTYMRLAKRRQDLHILWQS